MVKRRIYLVLLLLLAAIIGHAQRTILTQADEAGIWVRWTNPNLKSANGVNIYRREGDGEWQKITAEPVKYGNAVFAQQFQNEKALNDAKVLADGMREKNKLEGIGLALVLVNAVESRPFSQYLGILYQDKTAQAGKTYQYSVAELTGNSEFPYGESQPVKAGKMKPQAAVKSPKGEAMEGGLRFGWEVEPDRLVGANIYYKTPATNGWKKLNPKIILPAELPGKEGEAPTYPEWIFAAKELQNGVTYTCLIRGVDLFGFETEDSPEFSLVPIDKTPPAQAVVKGLDLVEDQLILTWDLPQAKEVEGIHIYRQVGSDTNWTKLTKSPLPTNTRRFEDRVVKYGNVHAYAIGTFDKAGNENRTDAKILRVMDTKAPALVRGLKAVADTGRITLTWFPNQDKDLAGYRVYRMMKIPGNTDTVLVTPFPIQATEYLDVLPKVAKNEFVYFVAAEDSSYNQSPRGAAVRAVLPDPEPPFPPTLKTIRTDAEALRLVWLPNLDVDLAGYVLYRSEVEKGPDSIWKPLTAKPISAKDTTYSDRRIEAGKRYYYRLAALDDAGNESEKSSAFMGTITTIRLRTVPQDVEVKHKKGKPEATLTWKIDPNPTVIGCMVYRKEGKGEYRPASGLITDPQFTDKGLKKGTTYYYEIRAFDKAGNYAKSAPTTLTIEAE